MSKKIIEAAGGIVQNEYDEILFIYRRGKWDLPKGKLDEGESLEVCAVREVMEETGLQEVELIKFIGNTQHEYFDTWLQEEVIKVTHWFAMKTKSASNLIPQATEDIEQAVWADKDTYALFLQNSYPTIIAIVEQFEQRNV